MKGQVPVDDPMVDHMVALIVGITVLFMVMGLAIDTQKQAVHQVELNQCQEKFGDNFQNGTMDGEYVCIQNGEVYNPKVHALNIGSTGNIYLDTVLVPLKWFGGLPLWLQIPIGALLFFTGFTLMAVIGPR